MEKKDKLEKYLKINVKLNMALKFLERLNNERAELLALAETVEELDPPMLEILNNSLHSYELLNEYIANLKKEASEIRKK